MFLPNLPLDSFLNILTDRFSSITALNYLKAVRWRRREAWQYSSSEKASYGNEKELGKGRVVVVCLTSSF